MDLALIPAVSGDFGVMPGHVPTVAELRPGVVQVHKELDKEVEKYFVSGGFAVAHADSSVEVTVVEAAKLEDLDPAAVKSGLAEYTARCGSARLAARCCVGRPAGSNAAHLRSRCAAPSALRQGHAWSRAADGLTARSASRACTCIVL